MAAPLIRYGVSCFGVQTSTRQMVELACAAEAAGFARFMLVERVETNDAMAQLAAMAVATERIGLGTGIANIYLRRPDMLGAAAVAVDDLSAGRLILGLGPNNRAAVERIGGTWRPPADALTEITTRLRALFAGEVGQCGPAAHPIALPWAAVGLGTAAAAGRHADGVMGYLATAERLATVRETFRQAAIEAGRDPDTLECSLLLPSFVDPDIDVARDAARRFLGNYAAMAHYRRMFEASGFTDIEQVPDALIDAVVLAGPIEHCRERLAALSAVGLTHVDLAPLPVGGRSLAESAALLFAGSDELLA